MKLDVNTPIINLAGLTLKMGEDEKDEDGKVTKPASDMTLADILINAALTPSSTKSYKSEEHVARYQLALSAEKARKKNPAIIEVSAETATFIKEDISRIYAPLIAGQVLPLLDGK